MRVSDSVEHDRYKKMIEKFAEEAQKQFNALQRIKIKQEIHDDQEPRPQIRKEEKTNASKDVITTIVGRQCLPQFAKT